MCNNLAALIRTEHFLERIFRDAHFTMRTLKSRRKKSFRPNYYTKYLLRLHTFVRIARSERK